MLPSLKIEVGADTRKAQKNLKGLQATLKKVGASVANAGQSFKNLGGGLSNLGGALAPISGAVASVAGGMFALVNNTADAAIEIKRMSQVANAAPDEFQRMAAAAKSVGIEQDQLADILKDVNDRVGDFITTGAGPMVDFFEKIGPKVGVTIDDFKRLSGPEALQLYVDSLQKAGVSQQEMTFYLEAMASDTTKLIPLLQNGGAEMKRLGDRAAELGLILDQSTIQQSEQFKDQMKVMAASMKSLQIELAQKLMPVFVNDFLPFLKEQAVPALQRMAQFVMNAIKAFQEMSPEVQKAAGIIAGAFAVGTPALIALGAVAVAIGALLSPIGLVITAVAGLSAAWLAYGDDLTALWSDTIKPAIDQMLEAFMGFYEDTKQGVTDAVEWIKQKFNEFDEYVGEIPDKLVSLGKDMINGLLKGIEEKWQALKDKIAEMADMLPEWLKKRLGIASPSKVFAEIGRHIGDGLAVGIGDKLPELRSLMSEVGSQLEDRLTDALDGLIDGTTTFKDAFEGMVGDIIKAAYRMLVIEPIMGQIKSLFGGGSFFGASASGGSFFGSLFSGIGSLFGFEGGGYTGPGVRAGGVDGRGGFPAILHPNEMIIDQRKPAMATAGVTVIQNNSFGAGVSRQEVLAMMPRMIDATKAAVFDAQRRSVSGRGY